MRNKEIIQRLLETNSNAILAEGFDNALIGYTQNNLPSVAVYDLEKCISILVESGMPLEDAIDYAENYIQGYSGTNNPLFVSL